jgi:hypothetical protein
MTRRDEPFHEHARFPQLAVRGPETLANFLLKCHGSYEEAQILARPVETLLCHIDLRFPGAVSLRDAELERTAAPRPGGQKDRFTRPSLLLKSGFFRGLGHGLTVQAQLFKAVGGDFDVRSCG